MPNPRVTGIHHVKLPVANLETAAAWYVHALAARRVARFDHHDTQGQLFAVILFLPGCATPVELRRAPETAAALTGFDPVTFGVADETALQAWVDRLDEHGIEHSPVTRAFLGSLIELTPPDGPRLRFYTDPPGGFTAAELDTSATPGPS